MTGRDRLELDRLYRTHGVELDRWCRRRFGDTVGEDAAASTWLIVARNIRRIDPATARAYLFTVARHEALRIIRGNTDPPPLSLDVETHNGGSGNKQTSPLRDRIPDPRADVHDQAADRQLVGAMLDGIAHLSRGRRIALIGRMVGLSYDEIGAAGGHPTTARRSANTWANRGVTEGRKQLREQLATESRWDR